MIKIKINKKRYKVFTRWEEVSSANLQPLEYPQALANIYKADAKKAKELIGKLTPKQLQTEFPQFYIKALQMFSNIPFEVLKKTDTSQITTLYQNAIEPLVFDMFTLGFSSYLPKRQKGFKPSMFLNGTEIPAYDLQAVQFCEATDLMTGAKDDIRLLRIIPEIYRQQVFNEKEILKRCEKPLQMDKVLDFFFIICRSFHLWRRNTKRFLSQAESAVQCRMLESKGSCSSYPNQGLEPLNISSQCACMISLM